MRLNEWISANTDKLGSEYELLFAREVLPHLNGLDLDRLYAQYPFRDNDGRQRYCDFAIVESDDVRVAIEIDGYDKRGSGTGMSHADFIDWQRRQASLAAHGWHVLRFANKDVRDFPGRCADHINALLERLRSKESGRVQIVTIENPQTAASREVVTVIDQPPPAVPEKSKGSSTWKTVKRGLLLVGALGVAGALLVPALHKSKQTSESAVQVPPSQVSGSTVQKFSATGYEFDGNHGWGKLRCRDALSWREASKRVGDVITVQGPLFSSKYMENINGKPTWMDVGNKFPNSDRLQLVVWGSNRGNFDLPHIDKGGFDMERYEGRVVTVCAYGKVSMYKGVPQIELTDMSQVRIVNQ